MPYALIEALKEKAKKKGLSKKRTGAYVYGNPTMLAIRAKEAKKKEAPKK